MNEQTLHEEQPIRIDGERQRPAWARIVFHLGDDLRWTCSGWTDFPRPVRRLTAAVISTAVAYVLDVDDTVQALLSVIESTESTPKLRLR